MSEQNINLKIIPTDTWTTGYNAEITISNNSSSKINFYLESIKSLDINWCDNFSIEKQATKTILRLQNWVPLLNSNSNITFKFGGNGICPLSKDFKIILINTPGPEPSPGPLPPTPIITEISVNGLPLDTHKIYLLGDIINISKAISIKNVYFSNKNIIAIVGKFIYKIVTSGSTCMKIIFNDGTVRLFGIFVKGFDIFLNSNLRIGSVSEDDPSTSIKFWSDFEDDPLKSKYCQMRYIYLNNGPGNYGWRYNYSTPENNTEPLGKRALNFIRNSFRLGMIPCFIYYNIPDSGESYFTDLEHIQNKSYMKDYYTDLKFLLDMIQNETKSDSIPVYIIFEPDFLGYMMQNSGGGKNNQYYKYPSEIKAYVSPVYENKILIKNVDPIFPDTLEGLVKSINYLCKKICPNIKIGWQINVWSSSYSGKNIPGQSLMKVSDILGIQQGKNFIFKEAVEIANFYKLCGITNFADFFSVDKYGLSFRGVNASDLTNAMKSMWGFNSDHWNNYLLYCNTLATNLKLKCILWQIPSSHLNSSQSINPLTNKKYIDIKNIPGAYEDSSITFFFGDEFIPQNKSEYEYWKKDDWKSGLVTTGKDGSIIWNGVINKLYEYNIIGFLSGAGVGNDTHSGGLSRPITDDNFFINKVQKFYNR